MQTNEKSKFTQILTNVAPQWQKFTGANCAAVEIAVRRYAFEVQKIRRLRFSSSQELVRVDKYI